MRREGTRATVNMPPDRRRHRPSNCARIALTVVTVFTIIAGLAMPLWSETATAAAAAQPSGHSAGHAAYGTVPLAFASNRGQTDSRASFVAQSGGMTIFLTPSSLMFVLSGEPPSSSQPAGGQRPGSAPPRDPLKPSGQMQAPDQRHDGIVAAARAAAATQRTAVFFHFVGSNPHVSLSAEGPLTGHNHYVSTAAAWSAMTDAPLYSRVVYRGLYPGIDLAVYGSGNQVEYDVIAAAGADLGAVRIDLEGASTVVQAGGDVVLHTANGDLRHGAPRLYQDTTTGRHPVSGGATLREQHELDFSAGSHDPNRALVVDPSVTYQAALSGTASSTVAVDSGGSAYLAGTTSDTTFPASPGAFQTTGGAGEAYVAKLNPQGTGIVYATYIGEGSASAIAIDTTGDAFVAGTTSSAAFPTTTNAFQTVGGGVNNAFLTEVNPQGSGLVYSTFFGASDCWTYGTAVAVGGGGDAFLTGFTCSAHFPVTAVAFQKGPGCGSTASGNCQDAFVSRFHTASTGSASLVYSTYLGGNSEYGYDGFGYGIAADASGYAYVVGDARNNFPTTAGAFQTSYASPIGTSSGAGDGFVTKFSPDGSALVYSTYLGGSSGDDALAVSINTSGEAYITGNTYSADFPVTSGAAQSESGCSNSDSYFTLLNAAGSALVYSTFLAGSWIDYGAGVAADASGNAYITGLTESPDFPTTADTLPAQSNGAGGSADFVGFLTKINPTASGPASLAWSSYLPVEAAGVAVDASGAAYVAGFTRPDRVAGTTTGGVMKVVPGSVTYPPTTNGTITTVLGDQLGPPRGPLQPTRIAVHGNLIYASENSCGSVRVTNTTTGAVTTVAGTRGMPGYFGDNGPAAKARLNTGGGGGLAVDSAGNLYIADTQNCRVREVAASSGIITTIAGTGMCADTLHGGPAPKSALCFPSAVAVDAKGNLYIAEDQGNCNGSVVQKVSAANGSLTTVAGSFSCGFGGDGGKATAALLCNPAGLALDKSNNLYISDFSNARVRKVNTKGTISTVAGTTAGYCCDGGKAVTAQLDGPLGIAVDGAGNLYIADYNNQRVREVTSRGLISTFAGPGAATPVVYVDDVAVDSTGDVFLTDNSYLFAAECCVGGIVREVTTTHASIVAAGLPPLGDGKPAAQAQLGAAGQLARDSAGDLFVADPQDQRVRMISASTGLVSTVAGTEVEGGGFGQPNFAGDGGPAISASLHFPGGVAVDGSGNVYIGDTDNNRVREVDHATGIINTVAGNGTCGTVVDGEAATSAPLCSPGSLAFDANGNLYIATPTRIFKVASGVISLLAGNGASKEYGDGGPATAAGFINVASIAMSPSGTLFAADDGGNRVRRVMSGTITTVAGNGGCGYSGDGGPAIAAQICGPVSLALNSAGALFIGQLGNYAIDPDGDVRVRVVTPDGTIETIAGNGLEGALGDHGPATLAEVEADSLVADPSGNLFIGARNIGPYSFEIREVHDPLASFTMSPSAIAAPTSLAAGASVGVTVTARDTLGRAASSAPVYLSFVATTGGGSAAVGSIALGATPQEFISDSNGQITITYTASRNPPTGGKDVLTAESQPTGAAVVTEDVYMYSTVSQYSMVPAPIAPGGSLGPNASRHFVLTALAGSTPKPGAVVYLSLQQATGGGTVTVGSTALTAMPQPFTTDGGGQIQMSYAAPASPPSAGVDAVQAQDALTNVAVAGADAYSFAAAVPANFMLAPWPIAAPASLAAQRQVTLTLTATDAELQPLPGARTYLSYLATGGGGGAMVGGTPLTTAPQVFYADGQGHVSIVYTTPASLPSGGQDTVVAQSALSWPMTRVTDGYRYSTVASYTFAPNPVAQTRTLTANSTVSVTMTAQNANATPAAGAAVYLAFIPTSGGGTANVGATALSSTPQEFTADSAGHIIISYRAPGTLPASGTDVVSARDAQGNPSVVRDDVYTYSPQITTLAGSGTYGDNGDGGPATSAEVGSPLGIAVDAGGNAYFVDYAGSSIRKVDTSGYITTVAGNGTNGYSGDGGPATAAQLNQPRTLAVDSSGNLYVADTQNNVIRKVAETGIITTVAGNSLSGYSGDGGPAASAELNGPLGVAIDGAGNIYIADSGNDRVRKVSPSGVISTVAGNGQTGVSGDGGPAVSASAPSASVSVDGAGNLYISDANDQRIRFVCEQRTACTTLGESVAPGDITTVAGDGTGGYAGDGGQATQAQLYNPFDAVVDDAGNMYISDYSNQRIRRVDPSGIVTTIAGNGTSGFNGDGIAPASAELSYPYGLAYLDGSLYVADSGNSRLRMLVGAR